MWVIAFEVKSFFERLVKSHSVEMRLLSAATFGLISFAIINYTGSIDWPAGTYGLPKPSSGCPWADGFQWKTGWRSQDMNGDYSNNSKSAEFHLDGEVDNKKVNRSFCMKTDTTSDINRSTWPSGQYCIYKYEKCPEGLTKGRVRWDDDDNPRFNDEGGTLPDGMYNHDTMIEFCCKTDGNKSDPVLLPTKTSFFLLAYNSLKCQMVQWATANLEWIYYDTEDDQNSDKTDGEFPYQAGKRHKIFFCYYRRCNDSLTGLSGTFHSPNYPQKYPDGQYCSWRITVHPEQQIFITFTDFILQRESNTDGLYIYDGENAAGKVLGVFYGGQPPPKEGINSSSNNMFVIFKSDGNGSYKGFSASYYSVKQAKIAATTTAKNLDMTSSAFTSKTLHTLDKTSPNEELTASGSSGSSHTIITTTTSSSSSSSSVVTGIVLAIILLLVFACCIYYMFVYRRRQAMQQQQQAQIHAPLQQDVGYEPTPPNQPGYDGPLPPAGYAPPPPGGYAPPPPAGYGPPPQPGYAPPPYSQAVAASYPQQDKTAPYPPAPQGEAPPYPPGQPGGGPPYPPGEPGGAPSYPPGQPGGVASYPPEGAPPSGTATAPPGGTASYPTAPPGGAPPGGTAPYPTAPPGGVPPGGTAPNPTVPPGGSAPYPSAPPGGAPYPPQ